MMTHLVVREYLVDLEPSIFAARSEVQVDLPVGARILRVANHNNAPVLYAVVDPMETRFEPITILMRGTDAPFVVPEFPDIICYLDTVLFYDGQVVLHFFVVEDQAKYRLGPPSWAEAHGVPFKEAQILPLSSKEDIHE